MQLVPKPIHSPLVSVILPVYNHQEYVEQALNSILYQTYPEIEIIIIDDGSKDESIKQTELCLSAWKNKEVSQTVNRSITFIKQSNQGAHETINRGLSLAKGDFLTILNSDDYYHPHRIQILVEQTQKSNAKFAFSYVIGIDESNRTLPMYHWWPRWYEKAKGRLFRHPTVGFILLHENFAVSTGNLFFSKDLYQEVGPFKNLKLAHDLDFILRALVVAEPLLIRENLYFYRLHRTNTQHQVKHLLKKELNEIYSNYLTLISTHPPKNRSAPCHWYWPLDFARVRLHLKMDHALNRFIERDPNETKENLVIKNRSKQISKNSSAKGKPIGIISHDLSLSGAPKLVSDLALALKQQGYKPSVLSLQDGPMRAELEKEGISVSAPSGSFIKRVLQFIFLAAFKKRSLTIVNSISSWPYVCLMALMKPFGTFKWYIHESSIPRKLDGRIIHYLFRWFKLKNSRRFWFGSQSTKEAWNIYGIDGDVLYWSGISSTPTKQILSDKPIRSLLSIGTASARKGTHHLIEAFLFCLEKELIPHDTSLTIIGFPEPESPDFLGLEDLILQVATSKFKDRVRLIGGLSPEKLDHYYDAADLFIQSSTLECLPLSLLTAMSKGMPIITTNVNGCAEAIQDKYNGYHCLPFDDESLAKTMVEAILNPEESRKMGLTAQRTFNERFSLEATKPILFKHLK